MRLGILVISMLLVACTRQESPADKAPSASVSTDPNAGPKKFGELSVDDVDARIKGGNVAIYDANPREVFDKRHVPGATWVQFDGVTADLLPKDKDRPLVFYCFNEK